MDKPVVLNQQSEAVFLAVTNDGKTYKAMLEYVTNYKNGMAWTYFRRDMKTAMNHYLGRVCSGLMLRPSGGYSWMDSSDHTQLDHLCNSLLHYYSKEVFGYHFTKWCDGDNNFPTLDETFEANNKAVSLAKQLKKETTTMKDTKSITITKKTYINDVDVATMSDDELFMQIAKAEAEVRSLEAITAKPKKLVARISEINKSIADLVKLMDSAK